MKFYNREKEIEALKNLKGRFRIVIVGRRRIGKTRLVEEFYNKNRLTLFVSAEKSEKEIINDWAREYKQIPKVNTFSDLFEYLFSHQTSKIIFIDEIQNILKVNKSFIFDLQRLIDKYKPRLIVSGSLIRTMKKLIEDYKSPIFGRFDLIIKLRELDFKTIAVICKDLGLDIETAFKLYAVFGGIPKYYELLEKLKKFDFNSFILEMFVYYPRPLYEEVRTMLKEEFGKEHRTFFSIVSAISQGNTKLSEIAGFMGKHQTKITKYLHFLKNDFEIITRTTPLINGKRGAYKITSNLINFWFANIWRYQDLIEKREEKRLEEILKTNLNSWFGRMFENTIFELIKSGVIELPFSFTKIGKQWGKMEGKKGKTYEIDAVALNEKTNHILFAESKWQDNVNARRIVSNLNKKAKHVRWKTENRKEYYAVFAKSFRKKIRKFEEKPVFCFDLNYIEKRINKKFKHH